ncbi:butyrophilin subfamily 2 member A2-like [Trichosurus vulpecula]|uniref:butyrophilin subfamily 2 member A2-like n=1 Tax=Trichosurus vulpecula TaxID=9337 RepID=UPI00186ADE63|nr:butyrophilin subfamily 2 member A2-like [Trichosurus vulpecula]
MSSFLVMLSLLLLTQHAVAINEIRVHPYTDVTLPCHFSFVKRIDDLEFSWEREDIKEEFEVEDDSDYFRFFRFYDFFEVFSKVVYQFRNNKEQPEEQNSMYEKRVSVDPAEIPEGSLSLLLKNVNFQDQAIYKCSAISSIGRGERKVKLIVEDSEEPQVQFKQIDDETVATCVSTGWYYLPNVTWLDRGERDLSNYSTVEILEEQMNGAYRVFSVLKYPVKLNEKYVCRIIETDVNFQPFRTIRKFPSKWNCS